ncbi:MAG: Spi family protease inhibitor, partial [Candidatus Kapaibacterium sp.]
MKQKLLLFGLLTFFGMTTFAKQVDENTAKQVGQNFLATRTNSQTLKNSSSFQLVYKSNSKISNPLASIQPTTYFYVFNASTSGFIIVAGDDNVTP